MAVLLEDDVTILHISDAHFGQPDERNEAGRITDALISAVHNQERVPDLCVFSGDLSFSGKPDEFNAGSRWLSTLLAPFPDAKLFIVPGNHDVVRGDANAILRHCYATEEKFGAGRGGLTWKRDCCIFQTSSNFINH